MLLSFGDRGIYCKQADVYIDPWKPVARALITHGHSDHARAGHSHYLCHPQTGDVLRKRISSRLSVEAIEYHQRIHINGVCFSFHPAGHITGSAQIRAEYKGEVSVASGDYKLQDDGISAPFEPVPCNTFITECTFGLPVYQWPLPEQAFAQINQWWKGNAEQGKISLLAAYSLGKAQRLLRTLDASIGKIYVHPAVAAINEIYQSWGVEFPPHEKLPADMTKSTPPGSLILAPPAVMNAAWVNNNRNITTAMASGWMTLRGVRRRRNADMGFIFSDHADWNDLNKAVEATGAETVIATHGYQSVFTRWLQSKGISSYSEKTLFTGESADPVTESAT